MMTRPANKNSPQQKNESPWLFYLLGIVVLLTLWTAFNGDEEVTEDAIEVVERQVNVKTTNKSIEAKEPRTPNVSMVPWTQLVRTFNSEKPQDAFEVHSWVVAPTVKKSKPVPPPLPVAPPVPFTYMGKLEKALQPTTVFLMANNKLISVAIGAKVNAQWQLDAEEANLLRFTFLSLGLKQTLLKTAKAPISKAAIAADIDAEINQ